MAALSFTIDRASLALADLVIPGGGVSTGLVVARAGRPAFDLRYEYAPNSTLFSGKALLSAVADQSTLPLAIHALAASSAARAALEAELEAALSQFAFDVTLTVDGVATTYAADPSLPVWGDLRHGDVARFTSTASVVIPVNPPGA